LSKRDTPIRDCMNVLAQIGVAAAVAVPVLACVNAELIVFCKVSVDPPAAIFDAGRDVLVLTLGVSVAQGEIETPQSLRMSHSRSMAPDRHVFVGQIACRTSGRQGFAIRILPGYKDLATPFEPGMIIWN